VRWIANLSVFAILQLLLISLQTSLWMQIFGDFPPPQFWLPIFVYWAVYRRSYESILMIYLSMLMVGSMTALPYGILLLILVVLYIGLYYLRDRIYWSGSTFYMLACGFSTLVFPIAHLVISWILESNPIHDPELFHWIISILMTMLLSLPLYRILSFVDRLIPRFEGGDAREGFR
jgi:hypothetical protein